MFNDVLHDVLFELGTEELPSGAVKPLACALWDATRELLAQQGLLPESQLAQEMPDAPCLATPRRISIRFQVKTRQADQIVTRKGPAYAAGLNADGTPSPALLGFAKSCGADVSNLETVETDKGAWWMYQSHVSGRTAQVLLPDILQQAVAALPIPKPMRWGNHDMTFVRPVHWAVLLLDEHVIDMDILGCKTNRFSIGHRFHHPESIQITSPKHYEQVLHDAQVVVDFNRRQELIRERVTQCAATVNGHVIFEQALLDEVTSIVEWPCPLLVSFDASFLHDVPSEALVAAMHVHQKCFPVYDQMGELLPYFITVSNIQSHDSARVIAGNERVMHARLSDAAFFYRQDKKQSLNDYVTLTLNVVFQEKLGSLNDKAQRISVLMTQLSSYLNLNPEDAQRAAFLCKADLMTAMVNEFPELEGTMGYYYAKHAGEAEAVALALKEQYMPRFAADALPPSYLGQALSLADRLDTLAGAFAIGLKPTGAKDPFKLRRHALAVVRLLKVMKTDKPMHLSVLLRDALDNYRLKHVIGDDVLADLMSFILDRLPSSYQGTSIGQDLIAAVRACQAECLFDFDQRIIALNVFRHRPEATSLSAASKRVEHLLLQQKDALDVLDETSLVTNEEKNLLHHLKQVEAHYKSALGSTAIPSHKEYTEFLTVLAGLREVVDLFFEHVMVMVDDPVLRHSRLAILQKLHHLFQKVAKISIMK